MDLVSLFLLRGLKNDLNTCTVFLFDIILSFPFHHQKYYLLLTTIRRHDKGETNGITDHFWLNAYREHTSSIDNRVHIFFLFAQGIYTQ